MIGLLAILFLLVPIGELYGMVQVAREIGGVETIGLLILVSVVGAWLAKMAGLSVIARFQRTIREGRVPSAELVDGILVVFAGALMISPGFLSDCLAILLLLPPTRALVRGAILRRVREGGGFVRVVSSARFPGAGRTDAWDVDSWEEPPRGRPTIGP